MRKIEEVMDDTACDFGHFNWQCLLDNVNHGSVEIRTLTQIVTEVALEYSRDAEKYYKQPECNCGEINLEKARNDGFTQGWEEYKSIVNQYLSTFNLKIEHNEY